MSETNPTTGSTDAELDDDWEESPPANDASLPSNRFFDRELSWLAFNGRVLELAKDESIPLLERVNFLAIFANNLDEFFMVRVAGLKRRLETGIAAHNNVGRGPQQVLSDIHAAAYALQIDHARVATDIIRPAMELAGVAITSIDDLSPADRKTVDELFVSQIFPVLTPLAVDPAHPFPYISGLSLNLAVRVQNPKSGEENFARVKVPAILP
ncbi:MAG: RNA degradosome polyphosphate kinase, partial [Actinobacteria bacterium]|nr:RNA degradosome polyphosphate kinase [Actinomycetota bacterium]